jgi:hypothetical protein
MMITSTFGGLLESILEVLDKPRAKSSDVDPDVVMVGGVAAIDRNRNKNLQNSKSGAWQLPNRAPAELLFCPCTNQIGL